MESFTYTAPPIAPTPQFFQIAEKVIDHELRPFYTMRLQFHVDRACFQGRNASANLVESGTRRKKDKTGRPNFVIVLSLFGFPCLFAVCLLSFCYHFCSDAVMNKVEYIKQIEHP